ncbi:unnamed protein product [Diamesa serratosioi]
MAPCVLKLCEKYFKSAKALKGSLVVINLVPNPNIFQRKIIMNLNDDNRHEICVMVKDAKKIHWNASHVTEKAQNYLMLVTNANEITSIVHQLKKLPTWNPIAQVVVIFTDAMKSESEQDSMVRVVFNELLMNDVLNVNVVIQRTNSLTVLEVLTWFPYERDNCADYIENIRKIDECKLIETKDPTTGIIQRNDIITSFSAKYYPKIPTHFHECPMKVTTFLWEPYVVGHRNKIQRGLEVVMIQTISQKMNLKPVYKVIDQQSATKLITANNETGLYADILQRKSDIMVGGLYENPVSRKYLSASIPYHQDDLTWCVAKAGFAPTWLNVFVIFSEKTWFAIIGALVITSLVLWVLVRKENVYRENFMWSFMVALSISTSQYGHYWPKKFYIKLFLATLIFYGLHINTAYHSYLISVLTRPRYDQQISTVENAIKNGMEFKVDENTEPFFKKNDEASNYLDKNHKICENLNDCLMDVAKNRSKAVGISREHAKNTRLPATANGIYCFPPTDNIFVYSVVMLVKKNHHLLSKINENIRIISESGLLSKWQKDSVRIDEFNDDSTNNKNNNEHGSIQMKLKMEHVEGAFLLVLIGLTLSALVFFMELFTFWLSNKKKDNKMIKQFENLFCHAS